MKIIASGAEAVLYAKPRAPEVLVKERRKKSYRHPELDARLRRARTRREANILKKLPVPGPKLISTDRESLIEMTMITAPQAKTILDDDPGRAAELAGAIGKSIAMLHDAEIIHGDLTTSNILWDGAPVLIDFGLSTTSSELEQKAVDLHLFRQALESKHHRIHERAWRAFLKGYRTSKNATKVLERLAAVERRGRNKVKSS